MDLNGTLPRCECHLCTQARANELFAPFPQWPMYYPMTQCGYCGRMGCAGHVICATSDGTGVVGGNPLMA